MEALRKALTPAEIRADIEELQALVCEAESRQDDPEAEIAASLFKQLIQRRERQLSSWSG